MSRASTSLSLLLGVNGIAWLEGGTAFRSNLLAPKTDGSADGPELDDIIQAARGLFATDKEEPLRTSRGELRVVVADRWIEWMVLPWGPEPPRSRAAERRFRDWREATLPGSEASKEVVFAETDSGYGEPRIAAALPRPDMEKLLEFSRGIGSRLHAVTPLSVLAWEAVRKSIEERDYVCAVLYDGTTVLFIVSAGKLHNVHAAKGSVSPEAIWRRMRLRDSRLNRPFPRYVVSVDGSTEAYEGWSCLPVSADTDELMARLLSMSVVCSAEFIEPPSRMTGWRAVVVAVCLLSGIGSVNYLARQVSEANDLRNATEERHANQRAATPAAVVPQDERAALRRVQEVNRAISELNTPVAELLRVVNPPAEVRVALLELQFKAEDGSDNAGSLRVTAEARTPDEMAQYITHLSRSAPLRSAYLTKHELVRSDGRDRVRFSVDVKWRG